MSRAGYSDDCDSEWAAICWRGAVKRSIRGKRGQAFLKELIASLEAMPEKRLIRDALQQPNGEVCAIGSVGLKRGVDMKTLDPDEYPVVAETFGVAEALVREIEYKNDECGYHDETPEQRWTRMHAWATKQLAVTKDVV